MSNKEICLTGNQRTITSLFRELRHSFPFYDCKKLRINSIGGSGCSPIHVVISWNDEEAVKLLLEHGADLNSRDIDGHTPLLRAISFGYENIVRILLENGADLNAVNNWGADCYAIARRRHPNLIKIFDEFKEKQK